MILTKKQIRRIKTALKNANKLEMQSQNAAKYIELLVEEFTNIVGCVDHLQGDGFGFTPASNNDTHITIEEIIKHAEKGVDITENFILENLSI